MNTVFVFVPDTLDCKNIGFLEGFSSHAGKNLAFYITNNKLVSNSAKCIGFCSENSPENHVKSVVENSEWIHINTNTGKIKLGNLSDEGFPDKYKIIHITYEYTAFKNSDVVTFKSEDYGEYFKTLAMAIKSKYKLQQLYEDRMKQPLSRVLFGASIHILLIYVNFLLHICRKLNTVVQYSTTAIHFGKSLTTLKWALQSIKEERRVNLKVGNFLLSKILDLFIGLTLLYFFVRYEQELVIFVRDSAESIVQGIKHLLNDLMGSPVGLKLNYAFNRSLGTFFLYHIALWRAFLQGTSPFLGTAFWLLTIPGALGFTFQAAILSDLVAFATFHVYCIYVYAARLYGLQIRGLVSLWRLFIGRKYNPLRERVDSYQYSHHQLFIGTLGFTILLFLLPTTFLYYSVFTTFRICLISLDGLLIRLRYFLQCLPLYVTFLWIMNSSCITGAIHLKIREKSTNIPYTIHATLKNLSLWTTIANCLPETIAPVPSVSWRNFFRSLFTGLLL